MKRFNLIRLIMMCAALFLFSCQSQERTEADTRDNFETDSEEAQTFVELPDPQEAQTFAELPDPQAALPVSAFGEVWGYVVAGRESALTPDLPISDVGYFAADVDSYGALVDVPRRGALSDFPGRVHLVAKCDGRALTHFTLAPGSPERAALVSGLLKAAAGYDGLQIDFENVPPRDADIFLGFLAELRAGLGSKMFTVAIPARTKKIASDPYDYEKIKPLVDRMLVMAYDEHWSTSRPGPIASFAWCERVAAYALDVIGKEKLVMGIPFYGRAWGSGNPSRALIYSSVETLIAENNVTAIRRENGIPAFDYEVSVPVTVYYEDDYSLAARMEMYKAMDVAAIGFWRLGQETSAVWDLLRLED